MKNSDNSTVILLKTDKDDEWKKALKEKMPRLEIKCWPDTGNLEQISYALLWDPPEQLFDGLVNLKVIFSIGAGVDGILKVKTRPDNVPLVRLSDRLLINGMVEYVVYSVLRIHRSMTDYEQQQVKKKWEIIEQLPASDCRVGIMGMGQLGSCAAQMLKKLGYFVSGYSRTPKQLPGINCFMNDQLKEFLQQTDILVCLLPLTEQTQHILNAKTFNQLPQGACVINAGRGGHLREADLLPALDSGQLRHAILDVFETEPLPESHPFWNHPNITLTPHIASQTIPSSAVSHIADGIRRHQSRQPLTMLYDLRLGY